jgi:hypothetical protein
MTTLCEVADELAYQVKHATLPDDPAKRRLAEGRRCHEFGVRAGRIVIQAVAEGALPPAAITIESPGESACRFDRAARSPGRLSPDQEAEVAANEAFLIAVQRWLPTRVPGFKFQIGRHGSVAHAYEHAMRLLAEQLADPGEFRDGKWFSRQTNVKPSTLRMAAKRGAVRVLKEGNRVVYSMRDATELWPDDMQCANEAVNFRQ